MNETDSKDWYDTCIEIAEHWLQSAPMSEVSEWAREAYLDELLSWPKSKLYKTAEDMKGETE